VVCDLQHRVMLKIAVATLTACVVAETPEDRISAAFNDPDFLWGSATAAYQVEGAWNEGGRQPSIWDDFCHQAEKPCTGDSGDVADDFYHRYASDIDMLVDLGFNSLRLSISWPRIFPKAEDGVHKPNPVGIAFYKAVLAKLAQKNVVPMVTIYHWDLPNDLDWLDTNIVSHYLQYAEFLFQTFPEIKHWATFNEPLSFCPAGYQGGYWPPSIVSDYKHLDCGHHVLQAHAGAVKLYREKFQKMQKGKIGIVIDYKWAYPWNASSSEDIRAAQMHRDFHLGWWADPIFLTGDYPHTMREFYGDNLPRFTDDEINSLRGSADFYGMNTYGGKFAKIDLDGPTPFKEINPCVPGDLPSGVPAGECGASTWLWINPLAMRNLLEYVHDRYGPKEIFITEFGVDVPGECDMTLDVALNDSLRVNYYRDYLDQAATAKRVSGVPIKGAFAWSLLDNLEWKDGFSRRFGISYVNFTTQERSPKESAKWFQRLLTKPSVMEI